MNSLVFQNPEPSRAHTESFQLNEDGLALWAMLGNHELPRQLSLESTNSNKYIACHAEHTYDYYHSFGRLDSALKDCFLSSKNLWETILTDQSPGYSLRREKAILSGLQPIYGEASFCYEEVKQLPNEAIEKTLIEHYSKSPR
jgi:hypothetical protein